MMLTPPPSLPDLGRCNEGLCGSNNTVLLLLACSFLLVCML